MQTYRNTNKGWSEVILDYLGAFCIYCLATQKLHIHHIIPVLRGGKNTMGNLEVVCTDCHKKIHQEINKVLPIKRFRIIECENCGHNRIIKNKSHAKNCPKCSKRISRKQSR